MKKNEYVPRRLVTAPGEDIAPIQAEEARIDLGEEFPVPDLLEPDESEGQLGQEPDSQSYEDGDVSEAEGEGNAALAWGKDLFFLALKLIFLLFLAAYIWMLFHQDVTKDVSMDTIRQTMEGDSSVSALTPGDANTLKRYYSLDGSGYEGYVVYTSGSMMDVSELLIVKVADAGQLEELEEAAQARQEEQMESFDGYGTNQYDLLEHAITLTRGNYFFYGVSEEIEQWEEEFLSCIQ